MTTDILDKIINPVAMSIDIPYYEDNSRISNSALGYFIISPMYFKKKSEGQGYELEGKFLENGTMIHKYILEPKTFWDEYKIKKYETPSSANQKKFIDMYITGNGKIQSYRASYSVAKMSDESVESLADMLLDTFKEYIEQARSFDGKKEITFSDVAKLKEIESNIKNLNSASGLIYPNEEFYDVYSEFHINWVHDTGLECKSLIDRLIIDHMKKTIYIVDLKTTAKISNFQESAKMFGYYRQLAFYQMAVEWYMTNVMKVDKFDVVIDLNEWKIETVIVAISTSQETTNEVRVFNMKADIKLFKEYEQLIDKLLSEVKWHKENDKFDSTKEFYETGFNDIVNKWEI